MPHSELDHLTITAPTLEVGEALINETLGVKLEPGGEHPLMGTHNRLLRLGASVYLEVIACNPAAAPPKRPRWFGLDALAPESPANLRGWVARTDALAQSLQQTHEPLGSVHALSRADKHWLMSIPDDGRPTLRGAAPTLMQWQCNAHPADTLRDQGLSLIKLEIYTPDPARIEKLLASIGFEGPVTVHRKHKTTLCAIIDTPLGNKRLGA
jgi:hypothetical protein